MRMLQFPFGIVEIDDGLEERSCDELIRSVLYYEKYLRREAA